MTEKEIEKLFKSKLDNREFAFNPANWEAMEAILDSTPKPAGAFYWRSVMAVLLFGVAVWSLITFAPVAAESNVVNNSEVTAPLEEVDQAQEANTALKETQLEENLAENELQKGKPEKAVAPTSAGVAERNTVINQEVQPAPTEVATAEDSYVDEVVADEFSLVDPVSTIPLSKKGFVFNNELPQALVEITSGNNFTPEAFKKFDSKSSFYLEVSPVFSGSYNANNVGVGWHAGLGWERAIGEKFQFIIGLGYTVQNGVGIENNSDSVFYNFGKELVETQEINRRLDYVELPVSISYKLNQRNMVELGMYTGYLVNVSRDVDKEISKFKTETQYESTKENGYQKEFKRMDYGLSLGYRYRLTPALSVGLHYNLGLVDITKNTQGDYLQRHTNQNTRVVFRYRFL
ncbi:Outer membrane protein transport protein (OMPP1/FadL/TodX) [Owenweeksia hongkongensis DSM 17368]|uniref:Outer membrane protein transport protein (OMPP1/FadL/TodX) n=1 Tax=Owenweeksia hongkongensis (strain DSM 17368 / CIP 108786 / JCM 12287 / NRRL B-23963 / UST20020801) TaxID=926562 RepID=G8R701_OWEHD|nr:outer membrane beta-barrel protein [Owenweeksia hongkongensis]AEV33366.1 Outer membrane protein transport protein (OMPP1/FadL/TodX) [Owenweeksia hongkongensis DSM 17368]